MVFKIGDECVLHAFKWVSLEELKTNVALVDKRCYKLVRTFFRRYLDQETAVKNLPGQAAFFGRDLMPFLDRLKSLRFLEIWAVVFKSDPNFLTKVFVSKWIENLEQLSISSPSYQDQITDDLVTQIVRKCPNLREVSLNNAFALRNGGAQLAGLRKLQKIALCGVTGFSEGAAQAFAKSPCLTSVTIRDCGLVFPSTLNALLGAPHLTHLELSQSFLDISRNLCQMIVQKGKNLTHLSFRHSNNECSLEALDAFRDVARKCHKLVCIDFTGCRFITNAYRMENLEYFEQCIRAASLNAGFKVTGLNRGYIIQLPSKFLTHIFSFLNKRDLSSVAQACRVFGGQATAQLTLAKAERNSQRAKTTLLNFFATSLRS